MRWFTSDLHFFHRNILLFCRPHYASVEEMNDDIVSLWNSFIKPEDTVYNLGDLSFQVGTKKDEIDAILNQLNGKHILILGNHDSKNKMAGFSAIKEVHDDLIVKIQDVDFLLSHFPFQESMPEKDVRERPECFTPNRLGEDGKRTPLLHGHTHDLFTMKPGSLCLCFDRWKRPVSELEIMEIYKDTNAFSENLDKYNNLHGGVH